MTGLNYRATIEGDDVLYHIGGTLTTANLSTITGSAICSGSTTLTLVFDGDNYAAIQNARQNQ